MKVIKKIMMLSVLLFTAFALASCDKTKLYDNDKAFCEKLEKYDISPEKRKQTVYLDLRETGSTEETGKDYATYHFNGAVNYNYLKGSKEEFLYWFTTRYNTNYTVFLFDNGEGSVKDVMSILKEAGYKEIYGYTLGYEVLRASKEYTSRFVEGKGLEGCDC